MVVVVVVLVVVVVVVVEVVLDVVFLSNSSVNFLTISSSSSRFLAGTMVFARATSRSFSFRDSLEVRLGSNSIEKFGLEKTLEFWLEIPYTKEMFKNVQV